MRIIDLRNRIEESEKAMESAEKVLALAIVSGSSESVIELLTQDCKNRRDEYYLLMKQEIEIVSDSENKEVSVEDVRQLRSLTGFGMMDCKAALVQNDGNINKAIDWLKNRKTFRFANHVAENLIRSRGDGDGVQ